MQYLKHLLSLSILSLLLSGCNIYVDAGKVAKSTTEGYKQYHNKTINISVLTPERWATSVSIGGEYTMVSPDAKRPTTRRPSISISSSPVDALAKTGAPLSMDGSYEVYKKSRLPRSTTLEAFKNNRLAFLTEKNIGPELRVSVKKSRLAKHDAYEILYSSKGKEFAHRFMVQETFTLVEGRVYRLIYYADEDRYPKFLKELEVVKDSYRILGD